MSTSTWGGIKIRFADHANTSSRYSQQPDFNCVDRYLTDDEIADIREQTTYPELAKKSAFAMHVGLSVPKVKKLLTPECYAKVVVDRQYPNTTYEFIRVAPALEAVRAAGITASIPVACECWSEEDYSGRGWY